jgi:hypothetical protein
MGKTIRRVFFPCCSLLLFSAALNAQTSAQPATVQITLGQAAVALNGPWKFTVGDSPVDPKTGSPLWAQPGFDDSGWETVDLTPKKGAKDPMWGTPGFVPGWTARGHAGYSGYAWYRMRVSCQAQGGRRLALAGPADIDDAYQAFSDGKLLGSFGNFSAPRPIIFNTQPRQFPLPETCAGPGTAQLFAFRVWMEPLTLLQNPDAGGMHNAPLLGEAGVIALHDQSQWLELIRAYLIDAVQAVVFALLAVVAFSLILFDRSDPVYQWIGLLFLTTAVLEGGRAVASWTEWIPARLELLGNSFTLALIYGLWVMVWWVWFESEGSRWLPNVLAGLVVLTAASRILGLEFFFGLIPHSIALRLYSFNQSLRFVFFGLLVWIVADGIRRKGLDGWLILPVVVLRGVGAFGNELLRLHLLKNWFPFGVSVSPVAIANFAVAAVIALLLLRRLLQSVKRQREMALDVKQAQEVQQVILPEHRILVPGLEIESEYRPAREVGGDFFQIIPFADGSLLIVAGDVAGKGLKAGMLVALLVGAIRTAAETDSHPASILSALNRRLLGRGDARATCLALRIARDGAATLANAGHLPPYLHGAPIEIEGSLPLGLLEDLDCSVLEFQLSPSDRLLIVSDGVPEATDEQGKLFGFDRVLELVRSQPSAAEIAETAQAFGQEDDISVISVTKVPVPESPNPQPFPRAYTSGALRTIQS